MNTNQRRLQIGIPFWKLGENSYGVTTTYLEYFQQFGDVVILTNTDTVRTDLDLLVLPGGMDAYPVSYKRIPSLRTGNPDVIKQWFFECMVPHYIAQGTPVFGICLGFQQIAILYGSELTQDLPFHAYSKSRTEQDQDIRVTDLGQPLAFPNEKHRRNMKVNSLHHQGVMEEDLGEDLLPLALADDKPSKDAGMIPVEALIHETLPVAGVQWHPEEIYDNFSFNIVLHLLSCSPLNKENVVNTAEASSL